ncbi:helix-turn-helix domain-containing protein [Pseudovibrio denitrificans]|uniref:helix-turn-helix domain-containing protein n=1 Tax=Pseudovibrio denitrificans TaxID=258256 RepID=UPI0039BF1F50
MSNVTRIQAKPSQASSFAVQYSDKQNWCVAITKDRNLSANDVRVGIILCEHINARSGRAWPSMETLAAEANASPRTAKRAIKKLSMLGYITITRKTGRGNSNVYELVLASAKGDTADTIYEEKGDTPDTFYTPKGDKTDEKGCQNPTEKGDTTGTQNKTNNKIKITKHAPAHEAPPITKSHFVSINDAIWPHVQAAYQQLKHDRLHPQQFRKGFGAMVDTKVFAKAYLLQAGKDITPKLAPSYPPATLQQQTTPPEGWIDPQLAGAG